MRATTVDRDVREAEARAAVYRFLARAFCHPGSGAIETILSEDLPAASDAAEELGEDVATPLAAFGHRLAHAPAEEVARGFERVFSHVVSVDWPPYETAYTSRGIFQQANDLADIAGFYAAYGTAVAEDAPERPDHVGVELEFMYLLCFKEAHARAGRKPSHAEGCREDQRRFLDDHLGRWLGLFAARLVRGAAGTPYADLAEAAAAFLARETALLGVTPEPVDGEIELPEPIDPSCDGPGSRDA